MVCPARWALSSKPAARRSGCQTMGQTDGRTDDRYVDSVPAHSAFSVKKQTLKTTHVLVVNGLYWSLAPVMF